MGDGCYYHLRLLALQKAVATLPQYTLLMLWPTGSADLPPVADQVQVKGVVALLGHNPLQGFLRLLRR